MTIREAEAHWAGITEGRRGTAAAGQRRLRRRLFFSVALREWAGHQSGRADRGRACRLLFHGAHRHPRRGRPCARTHPHSRQGASRRDCGRPDPHPHRAGDRRRARRASPTTNSASSPRRRRRSCLVSRALAGVPDITLKATLLAGVGMTLLEQRPWTAASSRRRPPRSCSASTTSSNTTIPPALPHWSPRTA